MTYRKICFGFNNSNSNNSNLCFPFSTLNCPKDRSSFRFLTTTIEKNIYTHCPNGEPEQEQEERNCETKHKLKHDSNLCIFACVSV